MVTDRRGFLSRTLVGGAAATALLGELTPELLAAGPSRGADPVGVALIGLGRQGRAILGELGKYESAKVVAVCDSDAARLESGARRAPGAEAFADFRAMLDKRKDVGAVIVATPTHLHKDAAVEAAGRGLHVYCEGPMASTLEDAAAIAGAARASKTVFQVGMEGRSNPIYKLARSFVKADVLKALVSARAQHHQKTTWRTSADDPARDRALNWRLDDQVSTGLAGELGTHQFDVVHWFIGDYPVSVRGRGSIRLHDDGRKVADTIECELAFKSGLVMNYRATLANSVEGKYELICGSSATVKLAWTAGWMFKEADSPTQGWEVYANRQQFHNDEGITLIADATKLAAQGKLKEGVGLPNSPLYYSLGDFLKSVSEGAPVACGADEGLRAAAVGILAHQAIVTGQERSIDERALRGA